MAAEARKRRLPPPWLGHLLVFGLLFALVLGWFLGHTRQAQRIFLDDAGEHARLLADAVTLHARGAVLAEEVTATILNRFLGNAAGFIAYLDGIAPFSSDELAAFAAEADLSVIRIVRGDLIVQGPDEWRPSVEVGCDRLDRLITLDAAHTILFGIARPHGPGCILVGMDSRRIESLRRAIGLPKALEAVAALPGVLAVRLEGAPETASSADVSAAAMPQVDILAPEAGTIVARATAPIAGARLLLDLDAGPLVAMRARLWLEFLGFIIALFVTGSIGTAILYRYQRTHEQQLLAYERRLSRQREEAGLGRAAAAIAHEIRNPLNAMAMGLQRLKLEADELGSEHRRLVDLMLEGVRRTNGAVSDLLDYARPPRPRPQPVALDVMVAEQLAFYRRRIAESGIALTLDLTPRTEVSADPDLLRQVLDNLLQNALQALEALPAGGELRVEAGGNRTECSLAITNDGLRIDAADVEQLLEPWFTDNPAGTGLGLAICRRIIAAHDGDLTLAVPAPGRLSVLVTLPRNRGGDR